MNINYNFYQDFIYEPEFKKKFLKRLDLVKKDNFYKSNLVISNINDIFIKEYFVEIFSWSVFNRKILEEITEIIKKNNLNTILDPCAGNAFHMFLFKTFSKLETITIDIQDEKESWNPIIEIDCLNFLKSYKNYKETVLFLSWLDYEELGLNILELYKGLMDISVGNYYPKSPNYLKKLQEEYNIIKSFNLKMPWGLEEKM
jgi:hypothetical protein